MNHKIQTYLNRPDDVRRMAGIAAARMGKSLSEDVANLIIEDCNRSGIAKLVKDKEVGNG